MVSPSLAAPLSSIDGLSQEALDSLVAHYDASIGVATSGLMKEVATWNPVDEDGNQLSNNLGQLILQDNYGAPVAGQITQNSTGNIVQFADPETGPPYEGQRLEGLLPQLANTSNYTIFWRGHYENEHHFQHLGMYAYNLGPNVIFHQRGYHGSPSEFNIHVSNSPSPFGDSITRFDDQDTVWSTVVSGGSLAAYANGINLNVSGRGNQFHSAPEITLGAIGPSGFDFVGEIKDLIIFRSALSDSDRALIRTHLSPPKVIVTNTNDSGSDTLRQAVYDSPSNTTITFAPNLSGQTITIHGGELSIGKNLTIDASSLPEGITINVSGQKRIFHIQPNNEVSMVGLTLTGGIASGNGFPNDVGGAIYNEQASLKLTGCTLFDNSATFGGAIYSDGDSGSVTLRLSQCTISDNSASESGGAIYSNGDFGSANLSLSTCTLSGNSASNSGGGIYSNGLEGSAITSLSACTLSNNTANFGGGVFSHGTSGSAPLSLNNTILAGNTAAISGPDLKELLSGATTTAIGTNLMSALNDGHDPIDLSEGGTIITGDPNLSSLGHYGGPTMTMPPLPGSPAINPSNDTTTDPGGTDQRGFQRFIGGTLDIGAVEFQGEAGELALTFDLDPDNDGISNGLEFAIGTNPILADAGDSKNLRIASGNQPLLTFGVDDEQQSSIILRLMRSTDLMSFDEVLSNEQTEFVVFSNQLLNFFGLIPPPGQREKAFYRLEAELRPIP